MKLFVDAQQNNPDKAFLSPEDSTTRESIATNTHTNRLIPEATSASASPRPPSQNLSTLNPVISGKDIPLYSPVNNGSGNSSSEIPDAYGREPESPLENRVRLPRGLDFTIQLQYGEHWDTELPAVDLLYADFQNIDSLSAYSRKLYGIGSERSLVLAVAYKVVDSERGLYNGEFDKDTMAVRKIHDQKSWDGVVFAAQRADPEFQGLQVKVWWTTREDLNRVWEESGEDSRDKSNEEGCEEK